MAASAGPLSTADVLKAEFCTTRQGANDPNLEGRSGAEFETAFRSWLFSQDEDACFWHLAADQILAPERFLSDLATSKPGSVARMLHDLLPENVRQQIGSSASANSLLEVLLPALEVLMREPKWLFTGQEQLFGAAPEEKEIFEKVGKSLHWTGKNRLLLQATFPKHVARIWNCLPPLFAYFHQHPRSALCLSGGGIRSATFALGVLQGLARHEVLDRFDYLSTVSGGGFIGGWVDAWAYHAGGFDKVIAGLQASNPKSPLSPEPEPLSRLREFSNYLTPKLGLGSADTWTLIGTYLRNLLLNWSIFIPALLALLCLPRICVAVLRLRPPEWAAWATLLAGVACAVWAIVHGGAQRPSICKQHSDSGHSEAADQNWILGWVVLPLLLSAVFFSATWAWILDPQRSLQGALADWFPVGESPAWWWFVGLGAGLHVLAWFFYAENLQQNRWKEFLWCALTGALGGALLWKGTVLVDAVYNQATQVQTPQLEWYVCFAAPGFLGCFLAAATLFIGLASRKTDDDDTGDADREWWGRLGAWLLIAIATWSLFSWVVLFGPAWLVKVPKLIGAAGGVSGLITLLLSHSGKTSATEKESTTANAKSLPAKLVLGVAAPVFILSLVAGLSLGTSWLVTVFEPDSDAHGAARFVEDDIQDLPYFAVHLASTNTETVAGIVWAGLSTPLQKQLANYAGDDSRTEALKRALVSELNQMISVSSNSLTAYFEPSTSKANPAPASLQTGVTKTNSLPANLPAGDSKTNPFDSQYHAQHYRGLLATAFDHELKASEFDHGMITHYTRWWLAIGLCLGFAALTAVAQFAINLNLFSLHAVYRERLTRAYLGASNPSRKPNPFTGFDPGDDLRMAQLGKRPLHIINIALNLVNTKRLAWQQRKAESFTASPLHAGSFRLGYRPVVEYATKRRLFWRKLETDPAHPLRQGLRLGSAVTISGAAASPNSGYHSSPILGLLMTLFNIRLGAWLGNPGKAGNASYKDAAPRSAFLHVVMEALGMTDEDEPYVYLSDGGHFENLGLYEMVLRRCHCIVVSDAGCDPKCALEDLGNAIRKIRIDLGIPIEMNDFEIRSREEKRPSRYCAVGEIQYPKVDGEGAKNGTLIYIKPALAGDEPRDVFNYVQTSPSFPHETTGDQWFSESQFESYRALGLHIVETIVNGRTAECDQDKPVDALDRLEVRARKHMKEPLPNALPTPVLAPAQTED
jgi:hypothetical protein